MSRREMVQEVWAFLRTRKAYWLVPMLIVFFLFSMLFLFAESSAVAPFIYTLF